MNWKKFEKGIKEMQKIMGEKLLVSFIINKEKIELRGISILGFKSAKSYPISKSYNAIPLNITPIWNKHIPDVNEREKLISKLIKKEKLTVKEQRKVSKISEDLR